jgi:hypothetical protein
MDECGDASRNDGEYWSLPRLWSCGDTRLQRKLFWVFNRPPGKIYIQIWPVEMIFRRSLHIDNLPIGASPRWRLHLHLVKLAIAVSEVAFRHDD